MIRFAADFENYTGLVGGDEFYEFVYIPPVGSADPALITAAAKKYLTSGTARYDMRYPRQDYPELFRPLDYVGGWAVFKARMTFPSASPTEFTVYGATGGLTPVERMTAAVDYNVGAGSVIRCSFNVGGYTYAYNSAIVADALFHSIEVRMSKTTLYFRVDDEEDTHTIPVPNRPADLGQLTRLVLSSTGKYEYFEVLLTHFDAFGSNNDEYLLCDGQAMAGIDLYLYNIAGLVADYTVTSAVDGFLDFSGVADGSYEAIAYDIATGYAWYYPLDIVGGHPA